MSVASAVADLLPREQASWGTRTHVARGVSRALALTLHNEAYFRLLFPGGSLRSTPSEAAELRQRMTALYEVDWQNVQDGLYPAALAHDFSWWRLLTSWPRLISDAPAVRRRAFANDYEDLPPGTEGFPNYYRRNFHYQSEGYFGLKSAALYEQQVEVLFRGTANAMRRQMLPPLVRRLPDRHWTEVRILDLACGTGPLLRMLAATFPRAWLFGCDLSPHYVTHARRVLSDIVRLSLIVANGEALPFRDGYFDAITCAYLFHEVPPAVRDTVLQEAARVLKEDGILVLADSIQPTDAPALARHLEHFPEQFHEPFYRHYLKDDIHRRLETAGFEVVEAAPQFVTKITVARKRQSSSGRGTTFDSPTRH
jgi:ubiquinone/menaquinone biosynthesis C-methylase UbiE